MRVFIVDTFYEGVLRAHYGRRPELTRADYSTQWRALMDTFFGTADSYSHYLGRLGHAAHEAVINCRPLERAWAREHAFRPQRLRGLLGRDSRDEILLAQADAFEPDVVYVQDLHALGVDVLRQLGRGRLLAGQIASELPSLERLGPFDVILTSFPHYVERLRAQGLDSEYLRIGFDPRVLDRVATGGPRDGAVFVGALGRTQHTSGNELLERAARRAPIDFWGTGAEEWPEDSPIRRLHHGEAWGLEMYRVLAAARIALNRHIDVAEDYANNMRLFEATGVGTLLLTDAKRNLAELFEPDVEVVAYADENELVERARHLLEHEEERSAIARAGQERTLREHSYETRMRELADILTRRVA